HRDAARGHLGEAQRVVVPRPDRRREVEADLRGVDVEGGDELDVADADAPEPVVHEAGDHLIGRARAVVTDALHEGVGAISDTREGDAQTHVVLTSPWTWNSERLHWAGCPQRTLWADANDPPA